MSDYLGLVTVLYNCEGVLKDFFDTLSIQTFKNFELIIIDNRSNDDSLNVCKKLALTAPFKCFFIENKDNLGVAAGNNQGINLAREHRCDKVLLLNNDIILQANTIESLLSAHIHANVDMSVPKIYFAGTNKLWFAGGKFNRFYGTTRHFGLRKDDSPKYNKQKEIEYAPTCFMLINAECFNDVGIMDERFFVYYDDTDFVFRSVIKNKKKLLYVPDSCIWHKVSYSTGSDSDFGTYYRLRNRIFFAKKHNPYVFFFYITNLMYHFTVRNIKMIKNRKKWNLCLKAMRDGWSIN